MKIWGLAAATLLGVCASAPASGKAVEGDGTPLAKSRLIVLSDIENEPDDTQSFIRLLLYANDIDIEAMIATTSTHMRNQVHPETMRHLIALYRKVRANLLRHAPGYPSAEFLSARIAAGQPGYGMAATGVGKDSEGSRRIIQALEAADSRPLWISVWGGANTLAQALQMLKATRSPAELSRLVSKLRVYTISDQDDSGAWIRREFPSLFYIVSPGRYSESTWGGVNAVIDGTDNTTISNAWLASHIQQGHGPLGAAYPDVSYGMEGDTPAFLGLIPNGLSDPEHPDWGSWGGRFEFYTPTVEPSDGRDNFNVPIGAETRPIWTNAVDTVFTREPAPHGKPRVTGKRAYKDNRATLWRWRDDFQNDFAARMDWTVLPHEKANHPPVVRLGHHERITVRSGETFTLSAKGSRDPDGDSLSYHWFNYPEAGTWKSRIFPRSADNIDRVPFTAPAVTRTETAHFIVAATDKGTPPLTRYRRVIVTIHPTQ